MKALIMDDKAIERAIIRISHEIIEKNKGVDKMVVVGIKTRGIFLAERIASKINQIEGSHVAHYALDVTKYRDDVDEKLKSQEESSEICRSKEESILINDICLADKKLLFEKQKVILVDDVLYTGRTIRSALNAILGFGRPASIQLAVLIDRGHRELPIRADYVGKNVPTSTDEKVRVFIKPHDEESQVIIY